MTPAAAPMIKAGIGSTKPAAGVMQTSPATAPDETPSSVGLPRVSHSTAAQATAPAAAEKCVAANALAAIPSAASALPALKPNQPTHNMPAPSAVYVRLWGGIASFGYPTR